jgi:putative FmdB family regulatory protein
MPVYEYQCDSHGVFTAMRPMSEYLDPQPCPDCGSAACRVMLSAPQVSSLSSRRKAAYATNERSQHAPLSADAYKAGHSAGCSCCSGSARLRSRSKPGAGRAAKSFVNKRPWMISH